MPDETTSSAGERSGALLGFVAGLFVLYVGELLVGGVLETKYAATSAGAYQSVAAMQTGAAIIRGFHYWSSSLLILGSLVALVWMLIAGWCKGSRARVWYSVIILFLASFVSQLSGNVLPFDRHGVQTAVIESEITKQAPVAGRMVGRIMLGGDQFNAETITRWHLGHIAFGLLGLVGAALFLIGSKGEKKTSALLWGPATVGLLACLMAKAPLGDQATVADYGSFDAQVSWYTWPLHGSLHLFSKLSASLGWIGSVAIPTLFAVLLIGTPIIAQRLHVKKIQFAFLIFGAYFLIVGLAFGGRFAALTGNRDPAKLQASTSPTSQRAVDQVLYDKGRDLFNANSCQGCHGKDGRNGDGGPTLVGVAGRRGSDSAWYVKFIKSPTSVKPNSMMPAFPNLSDEECKAIAEFLIYQK